MCHGLVASACPVVGPSIKAPLRRKNPHIRRRAELADPRCHTPWKRRYTSLEQAGRALPSRGDVEEKPLAAYQCAGCKGWHLTSKVLGTSAVRLR
jgi:hypothetical protein